MAFLDNGMTGTVTDGKWRLSRIGSHMAESASQRLKHSVSQPDQGDSHGYIRKEHGLHHGLLGNDEPQHGNH